MSDLMRIGLNKKTLWIVVMLLSALNSFLYPQRSYCANISNAVYKAALAADPISVDPKDVRNFFSVVVGSQVLEGLVRLDENMNIVPAIAESWAIKDNGKTTSFKIRRGIIFHNGTEVTSKDVAYSLSRIIKKEENTLFFMSFDNIVGAVKYKTGINNHVSGIVTKDDYTVEIHLIEPNPSFYKILAAVNCAIIPANLGESLHHDMKHFPISAGPFMISEWNSNREITLLRHNRYYGPAPHIQKLVFTVMSEDEIINAFNKGEIYDTFALSTYRNIQNDIIDISESYSVVDKMPLLRFIALNQRFKPLDNLYFRRALQYGLNKEALLRYVFDGETPSNSTIPYGIGGYSPDINAYEYSPDRARAMLAQSGLSQNELSKKIILWGRTSWPKNELFKKIVEDSYSALGLNIEVNFISSNEFLDRFYKQNMEMFASGHNIDMNDALFVLSWYESNTRLNFTGMSNKEFDLLMNMSRKEPDDYIKSRLYSKADQIIRDEAVQINLYNKKLHCYVNNNVKDFRVSRIGPFVEYKNVKIEQ